MNPHNTPLRLFLLLAAIVVYGSLIPFDFEPKPLAAAWHEFQAIRYLDLGVQARADLLANFIIYVPFGYMAAWAARRNADARLPIGTAIGLLAALAGIAIAIEFVQVFFKPRTVSLNDLIAETSGAAAGLAAWRVFHARLAALWARATRGGTTALQAALTGYLLAYVLLALFPYDFLLSFGEIAWKLDGELYGLFVAPAACEALTRCTGEFAAEALGAVPIGLLLALRVPAARPRLGTAILFGLLFSLGLELLQFTTASGISQGLSVLSRTAGIVIGVVAAGSISPSWIHRLQRKPVFKLAIVAAAIAYVAMAFWITWSHKGPVLTPPQALARLGEVHFIPFYYHYYTSEPKAVADLLYHVALYAPLGALAWVWHLATLRIPHRPRPRLAALWAGLFAVVGETGMLFLAGTHPDPTNILVALLAAPASYLAVNYLFNLLWSARQTSSAPIEPSNRSRAAGTFSAKTFIVSVLALGGLAGAVALVGSGDGTTAPPRITDTYPAPQSLSAPKLPGFRTTHPRLPAPAPDEVRRIADENPRFWARHRKRAANGHLYSTVLMAYVEPGSQNLERLHRRLMAMDVKWRGHNQVKPLSIAYDWLHARWTPEQRRALRDKTVAGCNHIIDRIRERKLSPYNVYLYNQPFQALMACAIATYRDSESAAPVMAFAHDYWKHRVLPVWEQVMGQNGGWHEGGEYVGIGIGTAVYRVPAMWRKATGEDLFARVSGLRGFLDFLIYRTRPDGQHFHWGDGGYHDRAVPDRIPLAIEYRHKAAYTFPHPPRHVEPTAWPWGPLPDPSLEDPDARRHLPLSRHFDGIGMVVARSDWSPQATYVTFKAGDNYWSHSHLDQGAFTIYKGGALAVDSGLNYGGDYGSDHHMSYSYQTIAHNTVTVKDPEDTVPGPPGPGGEQPRHIANDGGQRRIGSGWGVREAPLDITDWQEKHAIYHAGSIERFFAKAALTVAVADLTSAYTNSLSGKGHFAHRTRRVESFWRTFAYDRAHDAVLIFDRVTSTDAAFDKRWLLHTLEEPARTESGFTARVQPDGGRGHTGGRLTGHILLPRSYAFERIGGPGFRYYVDGRNYDNDGRLEDLLAEKRRRDLRPEPGAWRIEVRPGDDERRTRFLTVLLPTKEGEPTVSPRLVRSGETVTVELRGGGRATRWSFADDRHGPRIRVRTPADTRRYDLRLPARQHR